MSGYDAVMGDIIGDAEGEYVAGEGGIFGTGEGGIFGDDASGFNPLKKVNALKRKVLRATLHRMPGWRLLRQYGPNAAQMYPPAAAALSVAKRLGINPFTSGDDASGDTLMMGDDSSGDMVMGDIIGELIAMGAMAAPGPGQAVRLPGPGNVAFQPHFNPRVVDYRGFSPTKPRRIPMGFESTAAILAGGTARIISRPQVPMRVERLIVPSDIAGLFTITDLKVGNKSQFPASGSIPARIFQENAVGVDLQGDTAYPAIDIVIEVQNVSGAAAVFRAGLVGMTVQE